MFNSTLWLRDAAEVVLPWTDEAGGFWAADRSFPEAEYDANGIPGLINPR